MKPRAGVTLVEIMIAMVIFALIATSHATLTLRYATRVRTVAVGADRSARLAEVAARLTAVPHDSVPARAGCTSQSGGRLPNTTCVAVTSVGSTNRYEVRIVLTPTQAGVRPDTLFIQRARPAGTAGILTP